MGKAVESGWTRGSSFYIETEETGHVCAAVNTITEKFATMDEAEDWIKEEADRYRNEADRHIPKRK